MKKDNKAEYRGSMAILYSICLLAWNLYLKHWQAFKDLSDKYTQAYGQDMLAAVAAAKAMPDVAQRRGHTGNAAGSMQTAAAKSLLIWKRLERLIVKAYLPAEQSAALLQAGSAHYAAAARGNYSSLSLLIAGGEDFITKNTGKLQWGGMAATFPAAYATASAAFVQEYTLYADARGTATNGATDKQQANNALYASLMQMLKDAQTLFEENLNIRGQFTYKAIRNIVTKDVACGLHFVVRDKETKQPLTTATITFPAQDESYAVNKKGVLDIKLKKGSYTVVISVPGYPPMMREVIASAGIIHRVAIYLQKAASDAAAVA